MSKHQRYVVRVFFENKGEVDMQLLPIHELSKEEVIRKIDTNKAMSDKFSLYNFDWDTKDINKHGYDILTESEFWGES